MGIGRDISGDGKIGVPPAPAATLAVAFTARCCFAWLPLIGPGPRGCRRVHQPSSRMAGRLGRFGPEKPAGNMLAR